MKYAFASIFIFISLALFIGSVKIANALEFGLPIGGKIGTAISGVTCTGLSTQAYQVQSFNFTSTVFPFSLPYTTFKNIGTPKTGSHFLGFYSKKIDKTTCKQGSNPYTTNPFTMFGTTN